MVSGLGDFLFSFSEKYWQGADEFTIHQNYWRHFYKFGELFPDLFSIMLDKVVLCEGRGDLVGSDLDHLVGGGGGDSLVMAAYNVKVTSAYRQCHQISHLVLYLQFSQLLLFIFV